MNKRTLIVKTQKDAKKTKADMAEKGYSLVHEGTDELGDIELTFRKSVPSSSGVDGRQFIVGGR